MDKKMSVDFYDSFEAMHYAMKMLHDSGREITTVFPYEDGWCIVYKGSKFWKA